MTKRSLTAAFAAVSLLGLVPVGKLSAQYYQNPQSQFGAFRGSALSPYLSLTRSGNNFGAFNSTALNYYLLVQPQLNYNSQFTLQGRQIAGNQQAIGALGQSLPYDTTGHRVRFLNYQYYFNNLNATSGQAG